MKLPWLKRRVVSQLITKKEYEAWQKGHSRGINEAISALPTIMYDQDPKAVEIIVNKMRSLLT